MMIIVPALVLGVALGAAGSRLLEGLLYGVEPIDPATYGAAAVLLLGVATAATVVPVVRAVRIDPSEAVRSE
ncbi:MAG: hypothetical protein RQ745_03025 [Longimicrobiales bacterium]|nr:hypothetical protein [Longimicrobiales bacterium]